jgi:hypothetical protein
MVLVDIPVVLLALIMLAAGVWASLTTTRVVAWITTTALLWIGTASFTASALLGTPIVLLALGWLFTVAGLIAASYAASGHPRFLGTRSQPTLETRHMVNARSL